MRRVADASTIVVRAASRDDTGAVEAAIHLGNACKATVGYLPFAAYTEAAADGRLVLAATPDGSMVGYALFHLNRQRVLLTHVCVDQRWRRTGVARRLVDWISDRHRDRAGIAASCRSDYQLAEFWSRLGFQRLEERPAKTPTRTLVGWWRDHGHPSLFSSLREGIAVRAAVDVNVIRDISDDRRANRDDSLALLDDQLHDQLELVRTPTLDVEIDVLAPRERKLAARTAVGLPSIQPPSSEVALVETALRDVAEHVKPSFLLESSAQKDLRYVSEAIAAGVHVFATKDAELAIVLGNAAAAYGLRILLPSEVIVRIDELVRAEAYAPGRIRATAFTRRLIPAGSVGALERLAEITSRERRAAIRSFVRSLKPKDYERVGIFDPGGELTAAYVLHVTGSVLEIPVLRVLPGRLAPTLIRQLLFALRREALQRSANVIRLSDAHLDKATAAAAIDDGFQQSDDGLVGLVLEVVGSASELTAAATRAATAACVPPPFTIKDHLPAISTAEIERIWWPAKLLDSELATYVVPIQQHFSGDLLGAPLGLFARDAALGLSREHVYYRSPKGAHLEVPARLLWYMSASAKGSVEPAGIVAASILEEIVEGSPAELHARFRHLGVWQIEQVEQVARNGMAQALRFTYTETFDRTVTGTSLRKALGSPPQGPRRLSSDVFGTLYNLAHRNG